MASRARISTNFLPFAATLLFAGIGCRSGSGVRSERTAIHEDVVLFKDSTAGVQLLDVRVGGAILPTVIAEQVDRIGGNHVGNARTVADWVDRTHAIAGVNGGFFGDTYDSEGKRRQIVQMAVVADSVVAPGGAVKTMPGTDRRYLRSAIGFTAGGHPRIEWAAGTRRLGPRKASGPESPFVVRPWDVQSAVSCGPRLIHRGAIRITAQEERLASPRRTARTFVAYDESEGSAGHLILGIADAMRYEEVAAYLADYFEREHGTRVAEAMCLDGGASSQLVARTKSGIEDLRPTGVHVPTAILLTTKKNGRNPR